MEDILNFTDQDLAQFKSLNIPVEKVQEQIRLFERGVKYAQLDRACTPGDGILTLDEAKVNQYIAFYDQHSSSKKVMKFVPASGAASRMFKHLHAFKNVASDEKVEQFMTEIASFAFFDELSSAIAKAGHDLEQLLQQKDYETIISYLLSDLGLNYGKLPKAMIQFHSYEDFSRKAIEEHFVEGARYASNHNNEVYLHFTVSEQHLSIIQEYINPLIGRYEFEYNVQYHVSYSTQHSSTDTIAVDMDNQPFRKKNGEILFRPGGHGALLANLAELEADVIFVKNIDNVVKEENQETTYQYKKVIGGVLLEIQQLVFNCIQDLLVDQPSGVSNALTLAKSKFGVELPPSISRDDMIKWLNRPIRICGMVKNEGEPGGGPFWVNNGKSITPQIVESAQIDTGDEDQLTIMKGATHFNPVDLVCSTKNYLDESFKLREFRDMDTVFLSHKSVDGRELKALELPGLWNGAMADWLTLFVEVPLLTFNPVKTVNDLLKKNHL